MLRVLCVCLLVSSVAGAFEPEGHEVVEAAAYRTLMARKHATGTEASGREILAFLIRRGFLGKPRCFDDKPGTHECGDAERHDRPVDFWPILGSGSLDLLLSRQFGSRGQCFHFMADTGDFAGAENGQASPAMRVDAYQRCMRLATSLFDENLRDPYVAALRGRGVYVLLHMVADSFSHAHVERDASGKISFLRVWTLRNLLLLAWHHFDPRVEHDIVDKRDDQFVEADREVGGKRCKDYVAPYEVPVACLSADGRAAADTIADLLLALYASVEHAGGHVESAGVPTGALDLDNEQEKARPAEPTSLDDPYARAKWQDFVARHLASATLPIVLDKQSPDERAWQPNLLLGAVVRPDVTGNGWDAGVRAAWIQVVRQALPLIPLESVELGTGSFGGEGRWLARADLSFLIPIWDNFGLGFAPLALELTCQRDFGSCHGNALTMPARIAYFSDSGIWVDLTGPEYSWIDRGWSARLGLTIGAAIDVFDERKPAPTRVRRPSPPAPTTDWSPPPLPDKLLRSRPLTVTAYVEGGFATTDRDHEVALGLELRSERDADNRRGGLGWGVGLGYASGRLDGQGLDVARLAPGLRYYLITGFLSARLSPVAVAVGKWGEDAYADVGLEGDVAMTLGALEMSFGAPRVSYVHGAVNQGAPWYLRFSWRL